MSGHVCPTWNLPSSQLVGPWVFGWLLLGLPLLLPNQQLPEDRCWVQAAPVWSREDGFRTLLPKPWGLQGWFRCKLLLFGKSRLVDLSIQHNLVEEVKSQALLIWVSSIYPLCCWILLAPRTQEQACKMVPGNLGLILQHLLLRPACYTSHQLFMSMCEGNMESSKWWTAKEAVLISSRQGFPERETRLGNEDIPTSIPHSLLAVKHVCPPWTRCSDSLRPGVLSCIFLTGNNTGINYSPTRVADLRHC